MNMDTEMTLIAERAAEWLIRLETAGPEERAECWRWLIESPAHVQEMLAAKACQTLLAQQFRGRRIDAEAFVRQAANVYEIENHHDANRRRDTAAAASFARLARVKVALAAARRSPWKVATAASFVMLFGVATVAIQTISERRISTGPGEWQTKVLSDGTILRAGPRTKVVVEFTDERRLVRLTRGEAMFHVAKNPARPFLVETELATARAVGTAFAVSQESSEQVRVTVKEGIVAVASRSRSQPHQTTAGQEITLKAGEQVDVTKAGPQSPEHVDIEIALAWASGRLIFEHETVAQAVHEFNRRNEKQIRIVDQALAQRAVRGVFSASDPASFAAYLERQGAFLIVDEASGTLLLTPYPGSVARESHGQRGP